MCMYLYYIYIIISQHTYACIYVYVSFCACTHINVKHLEENDKKVPRPTMLQGISYQTFVGYSTSLETNKSTYSLSHLYTLSVK